MKSTLLSTEGRLRPSPPKAPSSYRSSPSPTSPESITPMSLLLGTAKARTGMGRSIHEL